MTNKQLQVLCLFVFTVGTVVNYIKCQTREVCRVEMFRNSNMILALTDDQKFMLIKYVLDEVDYVNIIDLLYPPDESLLAGRSEDDAIYRTIKANEDRIKMTVKELLGPDQEDNLEGISSYNTEVLIRRKLLNTTFRKMLDVGMSNVQMCVGGEKYKCKLVGLIKRTVDYRLKNTTECNVDNDGTCYITPTARIIQHDVSYELLTRPKELYQDYLHDYRYEIPKMTPYYVTLLFQSGRGLVPWQCELPQIEDSEGE